MNIEAKANIGDLVYVVAQINKAICPVCHGTKKIHISGSATYDASNIEEAMKQIASQVADAVHNNQIKTYDCPECHGKGEVKIIGSKKCVVLPCIITAMHIEISDMNAPAEVTYMIKDQHEHCRKLKAEQFFTSEEEATKRCKIANMPRVEVPIAEIVIPDHFARTIPCNEKIGKRMNEWRQNRKFTTEIYVDENNNLFDGYTAYLVYKMMGFEKVPVVIFDTKKEENV